jgi:branched-chain amino acid transport system permease protein
MSTLLNLLVSGIALGSIYGIIALGFVLMFKTTDVLNFAQGQLVMLGAFLATSVSGVFGSGPVITALFAVAAMGALGYTLYLLIFRHLVGKDFFTIILVTVGVATAIQGAVLLAYGAQPRGGLKLLPTGFLNVGALEVPYSYLLIVVISAAFVVMVRWLMARTSFGLHMRAIGQTIEGALVSGIDAARVSGMVWALAVGLAGMGGFLYANFASTVGLSVADVGLVAFPAAVIGGLYSETGAIVGGIVVGCLDRLASGYLGGEWSELVVFTTLFVVILVKPEGIFGRRELARI